jgi:ABC-2 type transport system ATP-binding protein
MPKSIIKFSNVSKSYRIVKNRATTLKEKFVNSIVGNKKEESIEKKVLNNFTFEIYEGETIGIIGENGAGKSTTLKLVANIIKPDSGSIHVTGSVASLLEIGAGFQADMTGKENVYLYGTILGLSKKFLEKRYDQIIDFAELHDFMDTPVKNYSSGMYMRLAFSVAIHVDPDIILIDEVLAVGDFNFQKKCMDKLEDFQQKGKTIIFVSHDMTSVRKLCNRVVYIYDNGNYNIGQADQLVNLYFSRVYNINTLPREDSIKEVVPNNDDTLENVSTSCLNTKEEERARWGNNKAKIDEVYLGYTQGSMSNVFEAGQDIVINIKGSISEKLDKVVLGIAVYDEDNNLLSGPNSKDDGYIIENPNNNFFSKIIIQRPPFLEGTYYLTVALYDYSCREPFDHLEKYFVFHVNNVKPTFGKIKLNCEWIV